MKYLLTIFRITLITLIGLAGPASGQGNAANGEDLAAASALEELRLLAEESFAEDDLDAAIALYRQLADRHTVQDEKTRVLMIVAYLEQSSGRHKDAVTTVRDALSVDPDYTFRAELYDEAMRNVFYQGQKLAVEMRSELAEEHIRKGNDHWRAGQYAEAGRSFATALGYQPDHPKALYNLALAHLQEQRSEDAEAGFQKLLALGDRVEASLQTLARVNLGHLYLQRDLAQEAEDILLQAVATEPSNSKAWSILGVAQRQQGKSSDAANAFRRSYELQPDNPEAMSHLALAYIDAEDWQQAVSILERATVVDNTNANLWLHLGRARNGLHGHGQGTSSQAIAAFENAIRLDPNDAGGWASNAAVHMAQLYYETQAYTQAVAQADRALAWRSDLVNAHVYQGLAKESLGDLHGARAGLETARQLDPTRADTHFNLGSVYYQLGLYDEAEAALERSLAIQANFPRATEHLQAVREARDRPRVTAPPASTRRGRATAAKKPRLGIRYADIDYAAIGLRGAMVERVEAGSAAARAGIRKNDLILKVDGRDVTSAEQLKGYVATRTRGSRLSFTILRSNVPTYVDVTLN